jgi:hypothetical protein
MHCPCALQSDITSDNAVIHLIDNVSGTLVGDLARILAKG